MIKIYGRPDCPNCHKAINAYKNAGVDVAYYIVGEHISKEELEEIVKRPVKSVPVIVDAEGREIT